MGSAKISKVKTDLAEVVDVDMQDSREPPEEEPGVTEINLMPLHENSPSSIIEPEVSQQELEEKKLVKDDAVKEEANIFGKKLKKTQTIKQKIAKPELETVHLKHHEFEIKPQNVNEEQVSLVTLGEPEDLPEPKKNIKQKKDAKNIKKKKPQEDEEDVKKVAEITVGDQKETAEEVKRIVSEEEPEPDNVVEHVKAEPQGGKSLDNKENKKEVTKEKLKEEDGNIFGKKLRKTETVKQKIEETQLEKVHLKHHEFEVKPQDVSEEQVGSICLGEPILEKTDKTKADIKPKDSKKLKKKKPKEKDDEQEVKDSV